MTLRASVPSDSTRNKWTPGQPHVCRTCGELREYHEFHASGNGASLKSRKTECVYCRRPKVAAYMRAKAEQAGPCYFCDEPAVYLSYCSKHWHQHRETHIDSHPEFRRYMEYITYVSRYFNVPTSIIVYSTSRLPMYIHVRMVAIMVVKTLTNASCLKMSALFTRNISTIIRNLQSAKKFYKKYPEFAEDVDGVMALLQADGLI